MNNFGIPPHLRSLVIDLLCGGGIDNTNSIKLLELPATFRAVRKRCPGWSGYICFAESVCKTNKNKRTVLRNFNKFVPLDEYENKDKRAILKNLYSIRNTSK